ncbi:YdcF family protein [Thermodesulfobacteriota bacterium]
MRPIKQKALYLGLMALLLAAVLYIFSGTLLTGTGKFLVVDETPAASDAVVVLNTGIEYYPRLIEAAELFRKGLARKIVINGNRKTDTLRILEKKGFKPGCPWYQDRIRILVLLGVPEKNVIAVSVENAYDTISEAKVVGKALMQKGFNNIIITTSKFHTRRARYIWKSIYSDVFKIYTLAAHKDPYSPEGWWKEGRQVRWVLAEYGAWIFYFWKEKMRDNIAVK